MAMMVSNMVFNKGGDKKVAVIIAILHSQSERVVMCSASFFQGVGQQLLMQKCILSSLINKKRYFILFFLD